MSDTQDKETLREAVARILAPHLPGGREFDDMPKNRVQYREWAAIGKCEYNDATQEEAFDAADAAIATMFERLRTPSEGMCRAGYFADDLYPKHQCDNQKELHRCVSEPRWRAMLDAFQQENINGR